MSLWTKRIELLLLPDDEQALVTAIQKRFPAVRFVDNRAWESPEAPPVRESILDCDRIAAIWNPEVAPDLPVRVRDDGVIDGPQVGPVVQWLRSSVVDSNVLQAGRWAASNDTDTEADMISFVKAIWQLMMKQTTNKLVRGGPLDRPPNPSVAERQFRVGSHALEAAKDDKLVLASAQMRLLPE